MVTEQRIIRTKRLLLRPFEPDDIRDVLAYANDPEWSRFLPVPSPYSLEDAHTFVDRNISLDWQEEPVLAIEYGGAVIGGIGFHINSPNSRAMLGYSIARVYWNQGLMTEAAAAVVNWGFGQLGLAKIYSFADVENVGSWRVMEKIGMTREGTFRSHGELRGVRQDFHYYGILRSEWEGRLGCEPQRVAEG